VGVVFIAVMASTLFFLSAPTPDLLTVLFWMAAFLIAEAMSFKTPTGKGNVSMAATIHLATVPLLGFSVLIPAVWGSRLMANLVVQRQAWYKALFNAGQVSLAVILASLSYTALGGAKPVVLDQSSVLRFLPALAAAAVGYYLLNTGLVSGVLALSAGTGYRQAWRENFGYRVEIVSSMALFLLAPVAMIAYQSIGQIGVAVFFLPMLFIRDACERYIALEKTQQALIGSERLAAKGEMAASVGHELNNYLAVLSGNLQLLQLVRENGSAKDKERVGKIFEQIRQMTTLSKGLMSFSHLESQVAPTDVCRLVQDTMDFLRPQNRLDGVEINTELDARLGPMVLDPAQIQQVLMNLINNATDAMRELSIPHRRLSVWVRWRSGENLLELGVQDNGPGVPPDRKPRVFEPGYTTKDCGHGFGLSTVFRIVSNHEGSISVEDAPGGGALFRVLIPADGRSRRLQAA
jgi:signal transduction histidine kinase